LKTNFEMIDNVKKVVTDLMNNITESDFLSCYEEWKTGCIVSEDYFEGDCIVFNVQGISATPYTSVSRVAYLPMGKGMLYW